MSTSLNILIIGAGAVGQTYGLHLQKAGASVSVFVREKYAAEASAGYTLYPLNGTTRPVPFVPDGVLCTAEDVGQHQWDQVWLAVSSPALKGQWLGDLLKRVGEATVVLLTPGLEDSERVQAFVPKSRLVSGMISLIAYQAPLPGEAFDPPGIAYWFPPFGPSPFSGSQASTIVSALTKGGQPAKQVDDVSTQAPVGSAVLMPFLLALEAADWNFQTLGQGGSLPTACEGIREALTIVEAATGTSTSRLRRLMRPWLFKSLLWLAPKIMPMDIEVYLAYHFVKVGLQTRQAVEGYLRRAAADNLSSGALQKLLEGVGQDAGDPKAIAKALFAARA